MNILLSVVSVFAVLACHWLGLLLIRGAFRGALAKFGPRGTWGEDLALGVAILSLVAWLFVDVAFCAALIAANHAEVAFDAAFLFAIANFTTVGAEPPNGAPLWSLAGPLTAMCGIFIFGWTTSFLVDCARTVSDFRRRPDPGDPINKR